MINPLTFELIKNNHTRDAELTKQLFKTTKRLFRQKIRIISVFNLDAFDEKFGPVKFNHTLDRTRRYLYPNFHSTL